MSAYKEFEYAKQACDMGVFGYLVKPIEEETLMQTMKSVYEYCESKTMLEIEYDYLKEISQCVSIPILRKDFVVDEYMIWEAKMLGASAVLLIVSILDVVQLKKYLDLAHDLGLSAIVEAHDGDEIMRALTVGAEIIGVNNRNLNDFTVDIENSISLRRCVSGDVIFISESGIKTAEDVRRLKENNVDAVLIGETLMRSDDKKSMILELKNA